MPAGLNAMMRPLEVELIFSGAVITSITVTIQVHESEVIIKLASALKMTHSELEKELQKSVIG